MILQQNIVHRDVSIPLPALNIELFISPDFTGRVVLYIENGRVICDGNFWMMNTFVLWTLLSK